MTEEPPEISVVIPAYDEEKRIGVTLDKTLPFLSDRYPRFELLVVDDGSTDDTEGVVAGYTEADPRVRFVAQRVNRGKGAAVRRGVLESRGAAVLFMDADHATPIEELDKLYPFLDDGYDIAIGSRALHKSDIREHQPLPRRLLGRGFNLVVRSMLLGGFADTQCGFKLFNAASAKDLFARQAIDGFAFDVEVLLLAKDRGYRIAEVPVVWFHEPGSKVSPIADASRMMVDLLKLRAKRLTPSGRG